MTGLKGQTDFEKIREAGVNEILVKPVSEDLLIEKVESFRHLKKNL